MRLTATHDVVADGEYCKKLLDGSIFLLTALMGRVDHQREPSFGDEEPEAGLNGAHAAAGSGDDAVISPGQVAEVEHGGAHGRGDMLGDLLMAATMRTQAGTKSRLIQSLAGRLNSGLLQVKGVELSLNANMLGEKEAVMTIACGAVDDAVPRLEDGGDVQAC